MLAQLWGADWLGSRMGLEKQIPGYVELHGTTTVLASAHYYVYRISSDETARMALL